LDRRTAVNRPLVFLVNLAELEVLRIPHDLKLALGQVTEGGGNQVSESTLVNRYMVTLTFFQGLVCPQDFLEN
jgi:hypothetical protein